MRIAYLSTEFVTEPTFYGGLAQHLGRLAGYLRARGHEPEVFVTAPREERFMHEGVLVHRVPVARRWALDLPLGALSRLGILRLAGTRSIMGKAYALDRALRRRAQEVRFDLVEASGYMAAGLYAVRKPVAPVIVFAPSFEPLWIEARGVPMTLDLRLWCRLEARAMKDAAAVYAHCRFVVDDIRRRTGVAARVLGKPYHWDPAEEDDSVLARVADWPAFLLFFGKMNRYKGSAVLADAIRPLVEGPGDLRLVLVGADPTDEEGRSLTALAASRPDHVRWLGLLKPGQIIPLVRRARGVVLPSLVENLANVWLEAMGAGAVVVGPNGASFDDLAEEGVSGILFRLGDAEALREAIQRVWGLAESDRARIGAAAKARIARLDPDVTLGPLEDFYASVVSAHAKRP